MSSIPQGSTTYVQGTTLRPWSAVVYVESTFADGTTYTGSGVVIGQNDILTAGHVVYSSSKGAATNVKVYPGFDHGIAPFGSLTAQTVDYVPVDNGGGLIWRRDVNQDISVLGFSTSIADMTGAMRMDLGFQSGEANVTGYPGVYGPGRMTNDSDSVNVAYDDVLITDALDINPGNSGGPVWQQRAAEAHLLGVVSTASWAASVGSGYDTIKSWMTGNDSLVEQQAVHAVGTAFDDIFSRGASGTIQVSYAGQSVDGGGGYDIITYGGPRSEFVVTQSADAWSVEDPVAGRIGSDTLFNIERISFADGILAISGADPAAQAYRLYHAALGRTPDDPGLKVNADAMTERGLSLTELADAFIQSAESQQTYGALDAAAFVTQLYRNVLSRDPDPPGLSDWVGRLNGGSERSDILVGFSESNENVALIAPSISDGIWLA